ncbi:FAD/NAD(P)-binding protein [Musicola paradisiaca]|uniref:Lipoprotein n=1 Tax=Musicola paradisiaca (strain Ech703) TaxID=579405 RepID=C6C2Z4_MUSP7|nr:FAD/NAD(P)-binding protein [Musicola paradisiaca]ACS85259.1 putative lipoprotein [Musicola paradisiaca Ech703]
MTTPLRIAIIGNGPRALSVLERLAVRLQKQPEAAVDIHYIDKQHPETGRIWRRDQDDCFVMNTVAEEVSAFSGAGDAENARPGCGPSLAVWWKQTRDDFPGDNTWAPRALYGEYMQFVLGCIKQSLSPQQRFLPRQAEVVDIVPDGEQHATLHFKQGEDVVVDRVVLATGHPKNRLSAQEQQWQRFAENHPELCWIQGDSAADMPLKDIPAGSHVGIIGLGLSFLDVMAALTTARGGKFTEQPDGTLRYIPSGHEPQLIAGSRSSLPIPGRGRNQKHPNFRYNSVLFTAERAEALALRGRIDFDKDVLPLLMAEVNLTWYATAIRQRYGVTAESEFRQYIQSLPENDFADIPHIARNFGITDLPALDIYQLADPFSQRRFTSASHFHAELKHLLMSDYQEAEGGNVDNPLKAALDTLRDTRGLVRKVVDFGGLTPSSFRDAFLHRYSPVSALLSAGPPRYRTRQVLALIDANILHVVGPNMTISCDSAAGRFALTSPQVEGAVWHVQTLLDARVPAQDLARDLSPLTQALCRRGIWQDFTLNDGETQVVSGGVAVTPAPFHPINAQGEAVRQLYVIGIPSEHTRWFMSAGSSRPGYWTDFICDADAIAEHILTALPVTQRANQE